jgi:hypothetical protein
MTKQARAACRERLLIVSDIRSDAVLYQDVVRQRRRGWRRPPRSGS